MAPKQYTYEIHKTGICGVWWYVLEVGVPVNRFSDGRTYAGHPLHPADQGLALTKWWARRICKRKIQRLQNPQPSLVETGNLDTSKIDVKKERKRVKKEFGV